MTTSEMTPDRTKAARELLAFYVEAGVDALLGEDAGGPSGRGNTAGARPSNDDARFGAGRACGATRPHVTAAAYAPGSATRCTRDRSAYPRHGRDGGA